MIDVEDVHVAFGETAVLTGASLGVDTGEFVGLIGPNGAGKTTLLRAINGVISPDAGRVRLGDTSVESLSTRAVSRRVATVPQTSHLGFSFTAEAVVEMGRTPHHDRLDWAPDSAPVTAAMERTETAHLADRTVEDLSGGERQRVLISRALAQETPALLLDEPTASLDINHQVRVLDMASSLADDDRAVLAAIHDLDLAARYCDRLALLHDGAIVARGRPERVLKSVSLAAAFETATAVATDPVTGTPTVTALERADSRGVTVHLAGHGQAAARALSVLWTAGFDVSLGIVPAGDVTVEVARGLDVPVTTVRPFEPPDDRAVRAARERYRAAAVCLRLGTDTTPGVGGGGPPTVTLSDSGEIDPDRVLDAVIEGLERRPIPADD